MFTDLQSAVCYDAKMQRLGLLRTRDILYALQVRSKLSIDAHVNTLRKKAVVISTGTARTISK